jgi:hypothetical protein
MTSAKIAQDGFVAARKMTNEEIREEASKKKSDGKSAALQNGPGINGRLGRGPKGNF